MFRLAPNPRIGVKNLVAIMCPASSQKLSNLPAHMERSKILAAAGMTSGGTTSSSMPNDMHGVPLAFPRTRSTR